MEHSFNIAESFNQKTYTPKMKSNKIITAKWVAENNKKALQGRAVNKDRFRKYGIEFDNATDSYDEDLINAIYNFHMRYRLKFQKRVCNVKYGAGW